MAESVIGSRQMPPFDIMSMILEGPKGYFGRRGTTMDQLWLADQEQKLRGQFAGQLLGTPQYGAAMDNPLDRRAQFGLWAAMQGGPESIANTGNTMLQQAFQAAYGHNQAAFEDSLALGRLKVQNEYALGQTKFSTDEQLRFEQGKLDIANRNTQNQLGMIFGANGDGAPVIDEQRKNASYDILAKQLGLQDRPAGMSVGQNLSGDFAWVPTLGSDQWRKAMDDLSPIQEISNAVTRLQQMDAEGYDSGQAQNAIATIQDQLRIMNKSGALDEGSMRQMSKYATDYGRYIGYGPGNFGLAQEKLRALQLQMDRKAKDWERKWLLSPDDIRIGDPYNTPALSIVQPSEESADTEIPTLAPPGKVGAGGSTTDLSIYGSEAPAKPRSGERAKRQVEELKKKFPRAKF